MERDLNDSHKENQPIKAIRNTQTRTMLLELVISQNLNISGNKCDPEPCENGAKCIRDNKRMDGYRCKCTSDFTGRNCQGNELNGLHTFHFY